jgi:hypothetical protein
MSNLRTSIGELLGSGLSDSELREQITELLTAEFVEGSLRQAIFNLVKEDLLTSELGSLIDDINVVPLANEGRTLAVEDPDEYHAMFAWRIVGKGGSSDELGINATDNPVVLDGVTYVDFKAPGAIENGALNPEHVKVVRFYDRALLHYQLGIMPGRQIKGGVHTI